VGKQKYAIEKFLSYIRIGLVSKGDCDKLDTDGLQMNDGSNLQDFHFTVVAFSTNCTSDSEL
jgi:hypothetical protein